MKINVGKKLRSKTPQILIIFFNAINKIFHIVRGKLLKIKNKIV